jgi:hypothetical protein
VTLTIELPINVARFIEPMPLEAPKFFRMWASVQGPPESVEEVFRAATTIDVPAIQKLLSIGCRLAILPVSSPHLLLIITLSERVSQ